MSLSFFPYIGCKGQIFGEIKRLLDQCDIENKVFVDLFGGSGAVALNVANTYHNMGNGLIVYNEKDGNLTNLFEVIRDKPEEMREWLSKTPISEELLREFKNDLFEHKTDDNFLRACKFFYYQYLSLPMEISFAGNAAMQKATSQSYNDAKATSKSNAYWNKIDNIDKIAKLVRKFTITNKDYRKVIEQYRSKATVYYLDPPYHKTFSPYSSTWDYSDFVELCHIFTDLSKDCYVIMSHYKDDELTKNLSGFNIIEIPSKTFNNQKVAIELLITNIKIKTGIKLDLD